MTDDLSQPDPEWITIQQHIANGISQHGRTILTIAPEMPYHGFGYTVGNHLVGLPELLLIGPATDDEYNVLNKLSKHMLKLKRPFKDGELLKPNKVLRGVVYDANQKAKDEYTLQATQYFEHSDYRLQQVVLADLKGHLPNDPQCEPLNLVPILRAMILS